MNFTYFDFPFYKIDQATLVPLDNVDKKQLPFLIIMQEKEKNEENLILLKKIFQALDLDIYNDCAVYLLEDGKEFHLPSLLQSESYIYVFIFGIPAKNLQLQINTVIYQWINIQNLHFLFAHPFEQLSQQVDLKKQLWAALKASNIKK